MYKGENNKKMEEDKELQGKYFSITEAEGTRTVIYQINRTEKEYLKTSPKYTVERLLYSDSIIGTHKKRTFYVENPAPDGNPLIILSFAKERIVVNMGFLDYDTVKISKKPKAVKCSTLYNDDQNEYKEFAYTPNMKRPFSIIDPETTEEIKPTLYFDEETNEVRGKCKLQPNKKYFVFEVKSDSV